MPGLHQPGRRGARFHTHPAARLLRSLQPCSALIRRLRRRVDAHAHPAPQVIVFEPIFPWYVTHIRMAGGTVVPVRLNPPDFALDAERFRAAFTPRTKMVIFNTPHNPTGAPAPSPAPRLDLPLSPPALTPLPPVPPRLAPGHVLTRAESEVLARECVSRNVIVLSDEVYERKVRECPLAPAPADGRGEEEFGWER